jgi:hypothetical protein
MAQPNIIIKSEKLTASLLKKQDLKTRAEHWRSEVARLTTMTGGEIYQMTVHRYASDRDAPAGRLPGAVTTGIDENDDAARRAEDLRRTLAGLPLANSTGIIEQLANAHREWSTTERAIETVDRDIEREKTFLAVQYCKDQKPKHDALMKRLLTALTETHSAWSELYGLKRQLIDSGVNLHGVCLLTPDFLGAPVDKYSDMASFFQAAKREGFVTTIPKEFV